MRMLRGLTGVTEPSGNWITTSEGMSGRAASYQTQITGRPANQSYFLNGSKFDGFDGKSPLEAKGPGYAQHLTSEGKFAGYFEREKGLLTQAMLQIGASEGVPIVWHIAEPEAAIAIRKLLTSNGITGITVLFTPPTP
jgi:filamentous hemagglutinin